MKIGLTGDYDGKSKLNSLMNKLYDGVFSKFFLGKSYGNDEVEIFMVIVCYPKDLKLRVRLDSKENVLYWDVMLYYKTMVNTKKDERKKILANAIINSFNLLDKYKKLNLDKNKLMVDATKCFKELNWI